PTTASIGIFGQSPVDIGDPELESREAFGVLARATVAPIVTPTRVVHFGASARYRTPDARTGGADVVRFRSFSETHVDRTRFLDTGNITNVSSYDQFALETAGVYGPLSVQAENVWTSVSRFALDNPLFGGRYAFVSWFVTGESRVYDPLNGVFLQPIPRRKLGALELALRYSTLDLNDLDVTGGRGQNWTLGVNWYANVNVRFSANYVITNNDDLADANGTEAGDDDFHALMVRMAYWF